MKHIATGIRPPCPPGRLPRPHACFPLLVACGLLLGAIHASAVTVKVDSTRPWIGWLNVFETNNTYLYGTAWGTADLPAMFIPTNSPSGWPLNTYLVLRPNTSTYNTADPFWNFPDGRPNKVLEPHFYVDVFTEFAGQPVTFKGSVTSNTIPGLTSGPATGWETIAFIKEFTPSYGFLGATTIRLNANNPFSFVTPDWTGERVPVWILRERSQYCARISQRPDRGRNSCARSGSHHHGPTCWWHD